MSDHNININFGDNNGGGYQGDTHGLLSSNFDRLNAMLAKLDTSVQKLTSQLQSKNINSSGRSTLSERTDAQKELIELRAQKKLQEEDRKYQRIRQLEEERHNRRIIAEKERSERQILQTRRTFGLGILGGIGYTGLQYLANQNTATMNKAGSMGSFLGANIQGQGADNYGSYIGNLYNIEKNREISRNSILAQGAGGLLGGTAGFLLGGGIGAGAGAYAGKELAQSMVTPSNAEVEQRMAIQRAISERMANASILQNRTGFSRFGLGMTNYDLVPHGFTADNKGIQARLSSQFENMYGMRNGVPNPNYNSILGISNYLQSSPVDRNKTGDLNKVIDNFTRAGFAVQDFTKLTVQGSLYQALTGKQLEAFSNNIRSARVKFGDAFDMNTSQTSLNLMAMGYKEDAAQKIAFQSQYNSGMMSNIERFQHQGIGDWYRNKIIGDAIGGFDINKSLIAGKFVGTTAGFNKLKQARDFIAKNGDPLQNSVYTLLQGGGIGGSDFLNSMIQPSINTLANPDYTPSKNSPERQTYENNLKSMIESGIIKTDQMTVNASFVNLNSDGFFNNNQLMMLSYFAPNPQGGSYDPSKK
jgi:hypothetical protein